MTITGQVLQLPWQVHSSIKLRSPVSYFAFSARSRFKMYGENRPAQVFPVQTFTDISGESGRGGFFSGTGVVDMDSISEISMLISVLKGDKCFSDYILLPRHTPWILQLKRTSYSSNQGFSKISVSSSGWSRSSMISPSVSKRPTYSMKWFSSVSWGLSVVPIWTMIESPCSL